VTEGGSSDDEIFTVAAKPRHIPEDERQSAKKSGKPEKDGDDDEGGESSGLGGVREEMFEKPRVSKRSMKKIKVNGGNGTRVVFDDDTGEALNPLVQMMRQLDSKYEEVSLSFSLSCARTRFLSRSFYLYQSPCIDDETARQLNPFSLSRMRACSLSRSFSLCQPPCTADKTVRLQVRRVSLSFSFSFSYSRSLAHSFSPSTPFYR